MVRIAACFVFCALVSLASNEASAQFQRVGGSSEASETAGEPTSEPAEQAGNVPADQGGAAPAGQPSPAESPPANAPSATPTAGQLPQPCPQDGPDLVLRCVQALDQTEVLTEQQAEWLRGVASGESMAGRAAQARLDREEEEARSAREAAEARLGRVTAQEEDARSSAEREPSRDDVTQLTLTQTAFTLGEGQGELRIGAALTGRYRFGASENVDLGISAVLPIAVVALGLEFKVAVQRENWALALHSITIPWSVYVVGIGGVVGAAGPILSLGNEQVSFHLSPKVLYLASEGEALAGFVMTSGLSARASDKLRLNLELFIPGIADAGTAAVVVPGLRYSTRHWAVNGAFILPIYDGASDIYRTFAFGIPFLSFSTTL